MGEQSKIEWCDHTVNLWRGCDKVSPGCANCYAAAMDRRFYGGLNWKGMRTDKRESGIDLAMRLNRKAGKLGVRYRVFNGSVNDWLDDKVPIEWLVDLLALIHATPNLDWLLLTKRPENWMSRVEAAGMHLRRIRPDDAGGTSHDRLEGMVNAWMNAVPPSNVWIGTTIENQDMADKRIPELLSIPARVRFLSCEPLLGPVDLRTVVDWWNSDEKIHWVIAGGESGPKARPMHPDWARSLRDQCKAAGVPFLFKQWGEWLPGEEHFSGPDWKFQDGRVIDAHEFPDGLSTDDAKGWIYDPETVTVFRKTGKKSAGLLLDGREHNEFPAP